MVQRGSVTGLGVLLLVLAGAAGGAAEETYVGTVAVSAGAKPGSAPFTLTIREYTSDEWVLELAQLLHKMGHAAAVAEMAKREAGTLRLGDRSSFRANVIRSEKTEAGRIVRVLTDRPMHLIDAGPAPKRPEDAVGYLELRLGAGGEGNGRLLPAAKAVFDSEGFIVPETLGEVWPVSNVKPSK